jgi:hypothetical protein
MLLVPNFDPAQTPVNIFRPTSPKRNVWKLEMALIFEIDFSKSGYFSAIKDIS